MDTLLTERQERFVFEYLKDQNAGAAAGRAGYTAKNLAQQGSELMNHPAVRDRVRFEMKNLLAEIRCSAVQLMKQRMLAAFFDPAKLVDGWEPIPLEELDAETLAVLEVNTVMRKDGPVIRVRQPDRHRALRALEKAHEKLDALNQKYWAQLARQGKLRSLEEIEAMDAGMDAEEAPAPASEISAEPQVLSGCAPAAVLDPTQFPEMDKVLSGCEEAAVVEASPFSEKPQVLSGPKGCKATLLSKAVASAWDGMS
jgi:phage terminase small subunit